MTNNKNDLSALAPYCHADLSHVLWAKSLPSTNDYLKERHTQLPHGSIAAADQQTAGKGRRGRSFYSPQNTGIYISALYRPEINPDLSAMLTTAGCVVTARAIDKATGIFPGIKWVNDLYIDGRKICGILAEAEFNNVNPAANYLIIGIGINLYPPEGGFPDDIADRAGAIVNDNPNHPKEPSLRPKLIGAMIDGLTELGNTHDFSDIMTDYRAHSTIMNKAVHLSGPGTDMTGIVRGFTDEGHLILEQADGQRAVIRSGEITLRFDARQ